MAININIPSQVKTYANLAGFPVSGSLKTIYIAEDTNKTYRWTGTTYVEISATAASTWGAIGGTLSNQTDLQTALNAKQDSLGFTAVPTTRTLTINGTTQDLSADRTFTISTGITIGTTAITSGTIGRILFEGTGNVVSESANLFWDNTNGRLGVGTSSPTNSFELASTSASPFKIATTQSYFRATFANSGSSGLLDFVSNFFSFPTNDVVFGSSSNSGGGRIFIKGSGATSATSSISIQNSSATELFRVRDNGNVGINTTTDAGYKLDVNGTARFGASTIQTLTVGLGAGSQAYNTVLGLSAFISNTSGNFNVAIGPSSLSNNTTGTGNIGVGHFAAVNIATGSNNVAIGREALSSNNSSGNVVIGMQACNTTTGNNNVVLGLQAQAGNFSGSVVLGRLATATANNQFVVGSSTSNVGAVVTETNVSTQYWEVVINGVTRKVLLA